MGNKSTVWISTIVTPNGAPRFSAIDWEKCTQPDNPMAVCLLNFTHFELHAYYTRDVQTQDWRVRGSSAVRHSRACTSRHSLCSSSRASSYVRRSAGRSSRSACAHCRCRRSFSTSSSLLTSYSTRELSSRRSDSYLYYLQFCIPHMPLAHFTILYSQL